MERDGQGRPWRLATKNTPCWVDGMCKEEGKGAIDASVSRSSLCRSPRREFPQTIRVCGVSPLTCRLAGAVEM